MKGSGGEAEGPKNKSVNPVVFAETSRPKRSREKAERPGAKKSQEDRRETYYLTQRDQELRSPGRTGERYTGLAQSRARGRAAQV